MGFKPPRGRVVVCSALALILGLLQPAALALQVVLPMPGVSLAMLLMVALYAYAGGVPAALLGACGAISSLWMLGVPMGAASLLLWLGPAILAIQGVGKREPFFRQLSRTIAAAVLMAAAATAAMALFFGSDMVASAVDQVRATFEQQKQQLWAMFSPAFEGKLTEDAFVSVYYDLFNQIQLYYEYNLLSNLLSGAAVSAMLSVLWGNWLVARRGDATPESFRGLSDWYLPSNTTFGLLLTLAVSSVLTQLGVQGAEMAWVVVGNLCSVAFITQCLAALNRRMRQNGAAVGRRTAMTVLLLLMGAIFGRILGGLSIFNLLSVLGCMSALFGRKGAARPLINKIKEMMDGDDR